MKLYVRNAEIVFDRRLVGISDQIFPECGDRLTCPAFQDIDIPFVGERERGWSPSIGVAHIGMCFLKVITGCVGHSQEIIGTVIQNAI